MEISCARVLQYLTLFSTLLLVSCGGGGGTATTPTLHWTKQVGVAGQFTYANSTATDASSNVYVAGYTTGNLDGNTLTGASDFFLTKYDANGTKLYTKLMGVVGASTLGYSTATDANGNVYVAGYTTGGLDGNASSGVGDYDFFLTKYDAAGTKLYTKQMGVTVTAGTGVNTYAMSTATDASGNVYVAGFTTGNLDGNTLTGIYDFFLTKYNASGTKLYTKQMGVAGASTQAASTATDASGNIYVAGYTTGNLDGNTLTGTSDFFLTKYDATGTKLYTKQMGVAGASTQVNSVATDASGNVYVAGDTTGNLDSNTRTGTSDFFLTKYDATGAKLYTKLMGVAGAITQANSTATDASGNVYVAGITAGGLDGNILIAAVAMPLTDFFLTKYDSSGVKQFTRQMGVAGKYTKGQSTVTDASGNVYVAGYTNGGLDGNVVTGIYDFFLAKYNSSGTKQ